MKNSHLQNLIISLTLILLFYLNIKPLEVVFLYRDPQPQVVKN